MDTPQDSVTSGNNLTSKGKNASGAITQLALSPDIKMLITILSLVFFYPIGLGLMWVWTNWPIWLKVILSLGFVLPIVIFMLLFLTGNINLVAL